LDTYSVDELRFFGFRSIGDNVKVHRSVQFYINESEIGSNARLDGPSIYTGRIIIGDNVHIGAFCRLAAGNVEIQINNDAGISSHCALYAASQDFVDPQAFANPTHSEISQKVVAKSISIGVRSMIGCGVIILPGVQIGSECAIAAGSIIRRSIDDNLLVIGTGDKIRTFSRKLR